MSSSEPLVAAVLREKDTNGDTLQVWSYPNVDEDVAAAIEARSQLEQTTESFFFHRVRNQWIYCLSKLNDASQGDLAKVVAVEISVIARVRAAQGPAARAAESVADRAAAATRSLPRSPEAAAPTR